MRSRTLYSCLFLCLGFVGLTTHSLAQTIVTGTVSPTSVCAGGSVSVSYTVSGTFAAGNIFSAQLSDATGSFPATPVVMGTLTSTTSGTINGTVPASTAGGTGYRVRVISSNPAKTGSTGLLTLTVTATTAPGVTAPPVYCEGSTAAALVATPSSGGSLRWYGTAATGGTASTTATTPNTSLIGNTTYYVSQVVNGCEGPRAAITVTVTNKPAAPGTASLSYCTGQTASALTATPVTGGTLNWYGTAATGGTASSIAPTPATSSTGTTTYYVSQAVGSCESPRAALPVTVNPAPAVPTAPTPAPYCEGASAVALTATGQNLKWYGANATGGTGSSVATIPNTTVVGTSNYYVSQTVSGCESARKAIAVTVNAAPPAPAATPPPAYCQNQPAAALVATPSSGGTLNWYGTAATGGTVSATATIPNTSAAGPINYYVSQTVSGCEGPRALIAVTIKAIPPSPGVVSPIIACQNRTGYALTATPSTGGTLNWYGTAATGGTATATPGAISTTAVGSTTYYVSQSLNGCESTRAGLTVTVNPVPAAPAFTAPAPYCEGASAVALMATPSSGGSLKWYGMAATGGTASTVAPVPGTATAFIGTSIYYVSQTVNSCESERAAISVQVKDTPVAPTTAAVDFCQGSPVPVLTATLIASATPNWYGTATGGTSSTVAPIATNTTVGTTLYYVSQTLNGCEGPRASLSVRVKALPAAPAVSPASFCFNSPATPLTATGTALKWYDAANALLAGAPIPPTNKVGSLVYNVSQTSAEGCEGPKANLTVTVNPIPSAPTATAPRAYCQGETAAPLVATGLALKWYGVDSTNKSPSTTATVPATTASFIGTKSYYVSQTILGCESAVYAIPVQVKTTPNPPAVQDVSFCQNYTAAVLAATPVSGATLNWYGENATGGTASPIPPAIPTSVDKTYTYYVSQTLDGCESGLGGPSGRAQIKARVKTTPNAPGVNPISFCNNEQAQALTASGINLRWYNSDDSFAGSAPPKPSTNTVGNQLFKVSQTSAEGCESPKASLTVTINPLPGLPGVSNLSYCQKQQDQPAQNLAPLTASGQNLRWYNTAGNAFASAPIPSIDQAGTQIYQVSQTVNSCEGDKATITVSINTLPAPTTPKSLVVYCVNDKAVPLEAIGASDSQLKWIDPYGNVTGNAPVPSTLNTNIEPGGDPFYVYQIGTNGCYSPRAVIRAVVTSPPTLALLAPVANVNLGQKAALQLKFTSSGPFSYTLTGGYVGKSLTTDTTIAVLPRGNTIYQVEAVSNGCGVGLPGNPATAQVTVRVPTVVTSALTASTLCAGTSLAVPFTTTGEFNPGNTFRLEMVSLTDSTKKIDIPGTATGSPITGVLSTTLPGGQYYVRVKADNPEIAITGSNSPTPLTVRAIASAVLTGTQAIYEGVPANLTLTLGGDAPWTVVYADSLQSYSATTTTNPYVVEVRPVRTTTYRLTSVSNFCGSGPVSGSATIAVLPLLGVVDNPLDPLVKTYPVPTETILMVEVNLPLTREPASLLLTDAGGRPVMQRVTRSQTNELDLTSQPSGVYLLRIQVGNRQTVRKIVKQ